MFTLGLHTNAVLVVHVVDLVDPQPLPLVQFLLLEQEQEQELHQDKLEPDLRVPVF